MKKLLIEVNSEFKNLLKCSVMILANSVKRVELFASAQLNSRLHLDNQATKFTADIIKFPFR